jgi:hypothetical protein
MWTVTQVTTTVQTLLTTTANRLARETGFVRRASKLTGAHFVQALVFGWLNNPNATLQQLAQMAGTVGVPISSQGLDQRFSQVAANLLRRVLEVAVGSLVTADPVAIPLLQRFRGVYLLDSSTIVLPNELAAVWHGCGGRPPEPSEPPAIRRRRRRLQSSCRSSSTCSAAPSAVRSCRMGARMIGGPHTRRSFLRVRCAWQTWAPSAWRPSPP